MAGDTIAPGGGHRPERGKPGPKDRRKKGQAFIRWNKYITLIIQKRV
jgi:hypothetical protein